MGRCVWLMALLGLTLAAITVQGRILVKRQALDQLDPAYQEVDSDDAVREKRHQGEDVKFGVKNALLGFVFNPSYSGKPRVTSSTTRKPTTTEDIVIFEKDKPVDLDIPSELIGSSFPVVTNVSTTIGNFMMNSALRAQRLLESMRPFLWKIFGKKGIIIEATTDKPIFSDGSSTR